MASDRNFASFLFHDVRGTRKLSVYPRAFEPILLQQEEQEKMIIPKRPEHPLMAASKRLGISLPNELNPRSRLWKENPKARAVSEGYMWIYVRLTHQRKQCSEYARRAIAELKEIKAAVAAAVAEKEKIDVEIGRFKNGLAVVYEEYCQTDICRRRENAEWEKKLAGATAQWQKMLAEETKRLQEAVSMGIVQRTRVEEIKDAQINKLEESISETSERRKEAEAEAQKLKKKLEESEERALQMEAQAREELVQVVEEKFELRDRARELEAEIKACKEKLEVEKDSALQTEAIAREEMVQLMDEKYELRLRAKELEDRLTQSKSAENTIDEELRKTLEEIKALKKEKKSALRRLDELVLLGERLSCTVDDGTVRPAQAQLQSSERVRGHSSTRSLRKEKRRTDPAASGKVLRDSTLHRKGSATLTESKIVNSVKQTQARRMFQENLPSVCH